MEKGKNEYKLHEDRQCSAIEDENIYTEKSTNSNNNNNI